MAEKTYRFPHAIGKESASQRLEATIESLSRQYGLARAELPDGATALRRTGVDAVVRFHEDAVEVAVDLNWFLEKTIRERIEDALHKGFPPLLRG